MAGGLLSVPNIIGLKPRFWVEYIEKALMGYISPFTLHEFSGTRFVTYF
jgi:hypothetical protein